MLPGVTWQVPSAGVVELAAVVLAQPGQVGLPVRRPLRLGRVEQHLGVGGAARALDLLQETAALRVIGGEDPGIPPVEDLIRSSSGGTAGPTRVQPMTNFPAAAAVH